MTGVAAFLAHHVETFNAAVSSADFAALVELFADDASLEFAGVPVGPFEPATMGVSPRGGHPHRTGTTPWCDVPSVRPVRVHHVNIPAETAVVPAGEGKPLPIW